MTWSPPPPLVGITGYDIFFHVVDGNGINSGIINNADTDSYTVDFLTNGHTYRIHITARSTILVSQDVYFMVNNTVPLGK